MKLVKLRWQVSRARAAVVLPPPLESILMKLIHAWIAIMWHSGGICRVGVQLRVSLIRQVQPPIYLGILSCYFMRRLFQVNDVPLCPMTHEEAVIFLRQAADRVKLRLYRDDAQTPIASMSPTSCENKAINHPVKQKACLRWEEIIFHRMWLDDAQHGLQFILISCAFTDRRQWIC